MNRALFLDRDGTLIPNTGHPRDPSLVTLIDGAAEALKLAQSMGYKLVIVSNQAGVAKGIITPEQARAVQARVEELFAAEGVAFDAVHFCFHGPNDACACRKPAPGMIVTAARALDIDCRGSIMIGDKSWDIDAGNAAGCQTFLLDGQRGWVDVARLLRLQPGS